MKKIKAESLGAVHTHTSGLKDKGITLVALVVTIVVLLILAGVSINLVLGENGLITNSQEAKISQEFAEYKEKMNFFIAEKQIESNEFDVSSIVAYKDKLYYNTKAENSKEGIEDVLGKISNKYKDKVQIVCGQICINTSSETEKRVAEQIGIKAIDIDVTDGTLISSNKNLNLIDEEGTLTVPASVTKIGYGAFSNVKDLKKVVIPETVEEIGMNAFANNTNIEEIIMQNGVKKIEADAFRGCENLKKVELPDSIMEIGESAFQYCEKLEEITLPKKLQTITASLFSRCTSIKKIILPSELTTIENYAFAYCYELIEINIPENVTSIGSGIFWSDTNLKNVNIDSNNKCFVMQNNLILSKDGKNVEAALLNSTKIEIPEGVINIKDDIFNGSNATSMYIPNSVENLSGLTFAGIKNLTEIKINEDNDKYKLENGNLYSKDGRALIMYLAEGDIVKIPEGVEIITNKSTQNRSFTKLILPSTLKEIQGWGLSQLYGGEVELPEKIEKINALAFGNITKITVSSKNNYIKSVDDKMILSKDGKILYAASRGTNEFNIPDTVEIIEEQAFYMHGRIKNIKLPSSIKEIRIQAFAYSSLEKIEIPEKIEKIEYNAFSSCSKLTNIIIDKKKDGISGAPWDCPMGARAVTWLK